MSISFYKMSGYVNTSLSPLSENELYLYKQNLPMLPSEALIEVCHLLFALIQFRIIFLQIIKSEKSSPNVKFTQPMCLTCITFFHDGAVNTQMYGAVISMLRLVTHTLLWLRFQGQGECCSCNQLLAGVR